MHRGIATLAFVIGFVGVMVLGGGLQSPAASQPSELGANRSWISPQQWKVTTELYPLEPGTQSHTSFGTLLPDGTYCAVGCPSWDTQD